MSEPDNDRRLTYLASKRGDLTAYASMIGTEFASRVDRLAQIIGTSHEHSVGSYKESLLRKLIAEFIPKRYSVGTGFVVFTRESELNDKNSDNIDLWNLKEHRVSKQLDIVVFDDYNFPPILRDGDFVVLRPEAVRVVIEVKGYLSKEGVNDAITGFIDFGRKWSEYKQYRKSWGSEPLHTPSLQLMAWSVYVPPSGESDCNGQTIRQSVVSCYRKALQPTELSSRSIPLLNAAYLYNDCIVSRCNYIVEGKVRDGYLTARGKFVRYGLDKRPFLAGDSTVASLLAAIHVSLETPFNSDFSYFDQSMSSNVFPHDFKGLTDLDTGKENDA